MRRRWLAAILGSVLLSGLVSHAQVVVPQAGRVLFDPELSSETPFNGKFCKSTPGDGGLIVANVSASNVCLFNPHTELVLTPSFRIETVLRLRQGDRSLGYGFFFGEQLDQSRPSYWTVTIAGDQARVSAFDGKQNVPLPPVASAPKPRTAIGSLNKLAIEVRGKDVLAFLNDQLLASGVASMPADGHFGLWLDDPGQEAVYTSLRVTTLPAATTTIATPPAAAVTPASAGKFTMMTGGRIYKEDDLSAARGIAAVSGPACTSTYADGGLQVKTGAEGCEWRLDQFVGGNLRARFEISLRVVKGFSSGMIVGWSDKPGGLHYHFNVTTEGFFNLVKSQNGEGKDLIVTTHTPALSTGLGAINRLAIEVDGQELRLFINGQFVGRATSPDPVQGGFGICIDGPQNVVVFSNLKMVDFVRPATAPQESPSSRVPLAGSGAAAKSGPRERTTSDASVATRAIR